MNLEIKEWKGFLLGNIFDIKKGKRLTSEDQIDGENNYIGAIDSNNGVANRIAQDPIHDGNTISLSYNGSVGEAFYQREPYWATDDVNALYCRYEGFNEYIGLFLVTVLRQEKYKFSYGRKWTLDNMKATEIMLPARRESNGEFFVDGINEYSDEGYVPDWQYMENYIKSLHHKSLTTKNKPQSSYKLDTDNWKEFAIRDLFDIDTGKDLIYSETTGSEHIVIGHGVDNNGVVCRTDTLEDYVLYDDKKTMSMAHIGNYWATVQCEPFYLGTRTKALKSKYSVSKAVFLFIATVINKNAYKFGYGRVGSDKIPAETIKLPVMSDGTPDWDFMEKYIKSLPYGDRL